MPKSDTESFVSILRYWRGEKNERNADDSIRRTSSANAILAKEIERHLSMPE